MLMIFDILHSDLLLKTIRQANDWKRRGQKNCSVMAPYFWELQKMEFWSSPENLTPSLGRGLYRPSYSANSIAGFYFYCIIPENRLVSNMNK